MRGVARRGFLSGLGAATVLAAQSRAAGPHPVTLLGNADVPPKSWLDTGGTPRGYAVDGAVAILRQAGLRPQVALHPWRRALETSRRGGGLLLGVFSSAERARDFLFSHAYAHDEVVLVVRRGGAFPFSGPADLTGRRVGFQAAAVYGPRWAECLAAMVPVEDSNPAGRLRMLAAGRLDAAVLDPGGAALRFQAARGNLDPGLFEVLPEPVARLGIHVGIPRAMPGGGELLGPVDRAVLDLREDGTLAGTMAAYHPEGGVAWD